MYSRPPDHDQQRQTRPDPIQQLDGAAQAVALIHAEERLRHPALAVVAWHLAEYAECARQAVQTGDADTLDEFVTLRVGALASLLNLLRAQWLLDPDPIGRWAADALAEIAYWLEVARQAIDRLLR